MANHGFIKPKKPISINRLCDLSNEILFKKFGKNFEAKKIKMTSKWGGMKGNYQICVFRKIEGRKNYSDDSPMFEFWLNDTGQIEFRHTCSPFDWIERVLYYNLASELEGICTDEGLGKNERLDYRKYKDKWNTYREYCAHSQLRRDKFHPHISYLHHRLSPCTIVKDTVECFGEVFADKNHSKKYLEKAQRVKRFFTR